MRRALSIPAIIVSCLILGLLVIVWASSGGENDNGNGDGLGAGALYEVSRGGFEITVPTSGELAALEQVNIHNELESGAVIIELVDEGTKVVAGDVLLRLNDESIKNAIRNAEDVVTTSTNNLEGAIANLTIFKKKRDSELAVKQLAVDLAHLALRAWQEGEVVARRQSLELAVQTAKKDFNRLSGKYESSVRLYDQEFLSKDELDRDEIALLNAEAQLKKAVLDVEVYNNYTFKQDKQKKESDLQQAKDELDRAKERLASEIRSAESSVLASQTKLENKKEGLAKLEGQLEMCVVVAPASGMVVYASSLGERRDREGNPVQVGKQLYRNELVMVIPNTEQMIAKVKVNEALSGLVEHGQKAVVICDAFPESVFSGEVLAVGVLASGGGWRDPNRRDYTVDIRINDSNNSVGLKPSMRCSAEVLVGMVENELFIPIHALHRNRGTVWVWIQEGSGFAQREVVVGKFSESYTVILDGLAEGDVVLLRDPPPNMVVSTLELEKSL
ncbi:MAG: HlyD family efflux transporter periplasmic adaptor subunit [Phycisphaerales bacterium]|nr:HlyD family efflux transporter periplasmic adaptor subunit [Phycisphaerales bacterium]